MKLVRNNFFAAPIGTHNQDPCIGRSHLLEHRTHRFQRSRFPNHLKLLVYLFAQALVFGHQFFAVQGLANGGYESVEVRRLGDVVVGSAANAADCGIEVTVPANHHKGSVAVVGHGMSQNLEAVALGHFNVAEDKVVARSV